MGGKISHQLSQRFQNMAARGPLAHCASLCAAETTDSKATQIYEGHPLPLSRLGPNQSTKCPEQTF